MDGSKTHLTRAITEEAVKLGVHPPQTAVQWLTQTQNAEPPPSQVLEHSSKAYGDFVPTVYVSYCSRS